ncbi:TonB-dependent receptor [Acinetobacter defluvii]|uniref:TonB-dependent receptor n=1 Tax=Acinetobacter defluvii TaxID=1871111 RepID=UPI003AF515D4
MSFIKSRKKVVVSALASSLSVIATSAIAQEESVQQLPTIHAQAHATKKDSLKVDESANSKFVAPLLDTPKSVSVISKKLIEDTKVATLADALRTVPGITLGAGEGGNPNGDRPFIRGYSSESSMYLDGVRNSTSQNREMFAVEQVEVTKGSASAMGGAGTVGGSINMISKVAKKGDFLEGSVAGGTDNYQRITLDGNKDFANGIAARVAVLGHKNEKPGQAHGTEYQRAGIAPSISFGLDTPTRATLSYYYLKSDDTPDSGIPYWDAGLGKAQGKPAEVKQGTYYGWKDRDFQKQENHAGTIKLEHDLTDNLTLTNTAMYSKSKNDYVWTNPDDSKGNVANGKVWHRLNSAITDSDTFTDQLALTGKFNTGVIKHSFNLGAEYSKQETDKGGYNIIDKNGTVSTTGFFSDCSDLSSNWCTSLNNPTQKPFLDRLEARQDFDATVESTSVYLLDNIEITPQWLLDLGVRWDKFEAEQNFRATASAAAFTANNDSDFFTYQAGLTFKPVENGSIYTSYATSASPVGLNAGWGDNSETINANNQMIDPEEAQTFELGTKWDLFGDRLNLTAAIFRTEKQNTRVQLDPTTYANVGESKVDGIELGLNGKITEKWDISAGYTYLDSELTKNGKSCRGSGATATCTDNTIFNGNQMPNVPKQAATLWTTYKVLPQLTLGGGAVYSDKVYGDVANIKWAPSYVRYDAMARYDVNKQVNVQLNVNNLSDKRYFTKAYASHYATEAEGRNAVLSLNFKY